MLTCDSFRQINRQLEVKTKMTKTTKVLLLDEYSRLDISMKDFDIMKGLKYSGTQNLIKSLRNGNLGEHDDIIKRIDERKKRPLDESINAALRAITSLNYASRADVIEKSELTISCGDRCLRLLYAEHKATCKKVRIDGILTTMIRPVLEAS